MTEAWTWRPLKEVTIQGSTWNPRTDPRPAIRYVDVSAISRDELRILSDAEYSASDAPSRARKIVKAGDTIFATIRPTLRRIAQIPASLDDEIVSTAFCVLRPNLSAIHPDFLYFAMQLECVTDGISLVQTGASYPAVRDADVLNQAVPLPPLSDQYAIATALKLARSAVLCQKRCEDAAMSLKRTAMQTLFTRGLRNEVQKDTEFGLMPESWELSPLGDHARQMQYGLSIRGASEGRCPILRMNCQQDGKVILRDLQYVDVDDATFDRYQVRRNDLLFNRTNSFELVGRTAIVEANTEAVFASYLIRVSAEDRHLDPPFLNYFLNWDVTQGELKKLASRGVSQANISAGKLKGFRIPTPGLDEQHEITSILNAIGRKIDLHRRKRAVLEELFKALLHKLITGEIRVEELDVPVIHTSHMTNGSLQYIKETA